MFKPSLDGISRRLLPGRFGSGLPGLLQEQQGRALHLGRGQPLLLPARRRRGGADGFGSSPADLTPNDLVCNANTDLVGIGRDAAAQIWYRALTVYMTSNTDYAGARVATLNAAADLYGVGSTQHIAVAAAWDAVNVH